PTNLLALDETAAVWRAHGVKVQHSHLIFVGDRTWPTTDRALEHFDRLRDEGVDIGCDAFPYVGGNTTLVVFMPPWTLNHLRRDAEEGSLRKVLQHGACCFETDTILTGNGVDNPASYGTFPRLLGRYVRELKLLTLPEAVRRMTGFNAERMNLRDRGRVERGLA